MKTLNSREIIVYYGDLVIFYNDNYYCKGGLGCFLDELASRYKTVYLCVPVEKTTSTENLYKLTAMNIVVQPLQAFKGFIGAIKRKSTVEKQIRQYASSWQGNLYMRWPTPFIKYVYNFGCKKGLPMELHIVGDSKAIINESGKYKGLMKFIANVYVNSLEKNVKKIMCKIPTLINGSGLRRLYTGLQSNNIKEIRSATLPSEYFKKDIKTNTEQGKILYVGTLKAEKGIIYLLDAIHLIIDSGVKVELTIVGDGPERTVLEEKVKTLGIADVVTFKGYVPFGETLMNIYYNNSLFVLPSISEGTPRVLLEAMANKLAIVTTNSGGITDTVQNGVNGIVVNSKSAEELKNAILKVMNDADLRNMLISNGYNFAKDNTIEIFVDNIVSAFER